MYILWQLSEVIYLVNLCMLHTVGTLGNVCNSVNSNLQNSICNGLW